MSDCSTNAMKAKKRPEVCPNCEHLMTEHASEYEPSITHLHCEHCGCSITRERKEPLKTCGMCQHQGYCHTSDENSFAEVCARFRPLGQSYLDDLDPHPLEKRCQQLEQVAREIFNRAYEFNRYGPHLGGIYIADFREQLEALGVSVDA